MTPTHCSECQTPLPEPAASGEILLCEHCGSPATSSSITTGTARILVVDDTSAVRSLLAEMLSNAGYEVETASDGDESLAKIESFHPDLVLLDLYLPRVTGFEVLKALEGRPDRPHVLVISGSHEPDSIQKVHELGAAGFIPKSALRDTLLFRVESLMSNGAAAASVPG